jgi:ketosteroid isomerase-like protein
MTRNEQFDEARQAVLECQHRFWLALQRKDADLYMEVLAEDFVCRSPGQEDQDRAAFIATLTSIPLTILNVSGEAIAIHFVGEVAVLTGTQIAQMRLPRGETGSQRLALTNIFRYKAGMWQMILAHPVSLLDET